MDDLWSTLNWAEGSSSVEPWEVSDDEVSEISLDVIRRFVLSLEDNPVRCEEHELLFSLRPQCLKTSQDIWGQFYLHIPRLDEGKDFNGEKDAIEKPHTYDIKPFTTPRPVFEDIEQDVIKEASSAVKTTKFWLLKSLRDDYVGENTYPRYQEAVQAWEADKESHEKKQLAYQAEYNKKEQDLYNEKLREIEEREQAYLHPSPAGIQKQIKKDLCELSMPFATSMAFAYSSGNVFIDLLYPGRSDIVSSMFSSVPKTQTEDSLRYLEIILGCACFVAMTVFNASRIIQNVTIVGHSNNYASNDDHTDSNLYAVAFDRSTFARDFSIQRFYSPYERVTHYLHILDVSKRYVISPISIKSPKGDNFNRFKKLSFISTSSSPVELQVPTDRTTLKKLDDRFEEAAKILVNREQVSTSNLQRLLGMGQAKANYVLDQLEIAGIVGPVEDSGSRRVYVTSLNELDWIIKSLKS